LEDIVKAPDNHSHVVRPDNMEWQKTRFEGCEVKNLMFDKKSGMATALMRLAPGAVLPDHQHVGIEQTWVIEGSLVDKEGPVPALLSGRGSLSGARPGAGIPRGVRTAA
jgi:anti-sigma factor ChrR (cupin superfamily)